MVKKLPSALEMLGFTFFVPQFAVGVFFEYRDYLHWAENTAQYKNIPSPVLQSLKPMVKGITCLAIYLVLDIYLPVNTVFTDEFGEFSFGYRLLYTQLCWYGKRCFYYTIFYFSTGHFIAIGLGYNGTEEKDGKIVKHKWDRIIGCYVYGTETASSANNFMREWNYRVHTWIKYYLSERLVGESGRPTGI